MPVPLRRVRVQVKAYGPEHTSRMFDIRNDRTLGADAFFVALHLVFAVGQRQRMRAMHGVRREQRVSMQRFLILTNNVLLGAASFV